MCVCACGRTCARVCTYVYAHVGPICAYTHVSVGAYASVRV